MTPREWLHQTLVGDDVLVALLPGGVYQAESFDEVHPVPQEKPYLVHRAGEPDSMIREDEVPVIISQPFTLWVHDRPGTYDNIDAVLERLRTTLGTAVGAVGEPVFRARWLGSSGDLVDDAMGTIVRNSRWHIVHH